MQAYKIGMFVFLFLCAQLPISSQEVPKKVKSGFTKKFTSIKKVKWEQESDTEWEAEFRMNDAEFEASFLIDGTWLETGHEILIENIPKNMESALSKAFPLWKIDEVEKLETRYGEAYEFELEQGGEELEIVMDLNGQILKREKELAEDEHEDND